MNYIKGKKSSKFEKGAQRNSNLLHIIHTNICFRHACMYGSSLKYFITFIENYSRYTHLYLVHSMYETLDSFIVFKVAIEK